VIEGPEDLRTIILDSERPFEDRGEAVAAIVESDPPNAALVLVEVGGRTSEMGPILRAAGASLARLIYDGVRVTEFDMRDARAAMYEALCAWRPPT
jgi:hypothetical protein